MRKNSETQELLIPQEILPKVRETLTSVGLPSYQYVDYDGLLTKIEETTNFDDYDFEESSLDSKSKVVSTLEKMEKFILTYLCNGWNKDSETFLKKDEILKYLGTFMNSEIEYDESVSHPKVQYKRNKPWSKMFGETLYRKANLCFVGHTSFIKRLARRLFEQSYAHIIIYEFLDYYHSNNGKKPKITFEQFMDERYDYYKEKSEDIGNLKPQALYCTKVSSWTGPSKRIPVTPLPFGFKCEDDSITYSLGDNGKLGLAYLIYAIIYGLILVGLWASGCEELSGIAFILGAIPLATAIILSCEH